MRKSFISAFMLGLLALGTTSTMVSCKDYDGDISSLKGQIASLEDQIKQKEQTINQSISNLQSQIAQANNDHATKAALAEAKQILEQAIANESADRKTADAELDAAIKKAQGAAEAAQNLAEANKAEIGKIVTDLQNVNTEIGNIKADVAAAAQQIGQLGAAIEAQKAGYEAADAAIKAELDALKARVDAAGLELLSSTVDNLKNVVIPGIQAEVSALADKINAIDAKYNYLTKALAKNLRSLVFRPDLYVDGIEAIEYPYLDAQAYTASTPYTMSRKHSYETVPVNLSNIVDYNPTATAVIYGPTWAVNYHMNPSVANPSYADVKGFAEREVEVVSRVAVGELGITSPEKYDNGTNVFGLNAGILTAGIKIAHPEKLAANGPAKLTSGSAYPAYGVDNIVALQVKSQLDNQQDTIITSDYALLYGEPVIPEAIIWSKANHRNGDGVINVDEDCPYLAANKTVHVYDKPEEALAQEPSFLLAWDDMTGINLSEYIATHYLRDCVTKAKKLPGTWAFGEEQLWGLHYEFETVEYKSSANTTIDSRFCVLNSTTGNIQARNVETTANGGQTMTTQDRASIDREPLVRVKLMRGTTVVLDGYILIKIVEKAKEADNKTIEEYASLGWKGTFDNCNALEWGYTTWDQFNDWVLTDELKMKKNEFDTNYTIDMNSLMTSTLTDTKIYDCKVYADNQGTLSVYPGTTTPLGQILYREDAEGINNHTFKLILSEKDIEFLTHDKAAYPVVKDFYACFNGGVAAPYKKVYVKFTVTLSRNIQQAGIQVKGSNYWFALDGNDNGWDAIALNVGYPQDNHYPTVWNSKQLIDFETNTVKLTDNTLNTLAKKFFFVPVNTEITDQHGVTWIVTARSGKNDNWWNALPCEYGFHATEHVWPLAGVTDAAHHLAAGTDNAALGKILKECAISYSQNSLGHKTAFDNVKLYAVTKAAYLTQLQYTQIAEMNPANGEITLVRNGIVATPNFTPVTGTPHLDNAPLDMILNAIGYAENKANISKQFHTWAGIAANNGCNVAIDLYNTPGENNQTYAIWEPSWERPINMNNEKVREIADAKDNGEFISIYDLLAFYDWRGPNVGEGNMENTHKWLWSYYNIHSVKVILDPTKVTTDIFGGTLGTTTLASKTSMLDLKAVNSDNPSTAVTVPSGEFNFSLAGFNAASQNPSLLTWFNSNKNALGYIFYANNGLNVETFTLRIPLEVSYEWGHFDTYVDVKINRTLGN